MRETQPGLVAIKNQQGTPKVIFNTSSLKMKVGSTRCDGSSVTEEGTSSPRKPEQEPYNKMTKTPEKVSPSKESKVVFETSSKYDSSMIIILSICVFSILFAFYKVYEDDSIPDDERKQAYNTLIWTLVSILFVFALVLPYSVQVRSDSYIGIRTVLVTWWFSMVTDAIVNPTSLSEHCRGPRYKFATTLFHHRVLVRRCKGYWDVLVSPQDIDGFIQAISGVSSTSAYINAES